MIKYIFWLMVFMLLSSLVVGASSLSFSFDETNYDQHNELTVTLDGPSDAETFIEITSLSGFYLPIALDDLSTPSFNLVLEPGEYIFKASSYYQDQDLSVEEILTLTHFIEPVVEEAEPEVDLDYNLTIKIIEFDGEEITGATAILFNGTKNESIELNSSGEASLILDTGSYILYVEKEGYVSSKANIAFDENRDVSVILLPGEYSSATDSDDGDTRINSQKFVDKPIVSLTDFEEEVYSSVHVPILFSVSGSTSRCQVLSKSSTGNGYSIAQNVLSPASFNEVVLTNFQEGDFDIRIRCIISDDEAIVSQTKKISIINIEEDLASLDAFRVSSQNVLDKINSFPSSFKHIFIHEVIVLEDAVAKSKELSKKIYSSTNLLAVREEIKELVNADKENTLDGVAVDSSDNIIAYGTLEDVDLVIEYLDLSKKNSALLSEQEEFAIKTNYNFVTLTYLSGLIKKQTFVSNQIIPISGSSSSTSFDEYIIVPTFLTSRLEETNDLLIKNYGDKSLVRLLENSSALIFDGWLDDLTLIKTILLSDAQSLGATPSGFVAYNNSSPTWKIPLFSFIALILLAGLFFNPYYSVLDLFEKNHLNIFTTQVHECIDASISNEHYRVIEMVPSILDVHKKLSSQEKNDVVDILAQVEELFYESSYHLSFQKIISKPSHQWIFPELEVAIKDFYGSYAKLSPKKQQVFLPHFNQMISRSQDLVSQVKK